ncbi:COMM domain-containing protein 2 [Nymphon striatum]|nr:COMM domain-containing protein 2 [Nymphon striatum]
MLIVFDERHKEHLQFIAELEVEVVQEFCRISINSIRSGFNNKIYNVAAQKLGVDAKMVQNGIKSLIYLFSESARLLLTEIDFHDSILTLGMKEGIIEVLLKFYKDNVDELRTILAGMQLLLPQYNNLEWRLDVQLASRSLHHQMEPIITLKLNVNDKGQNEDIVLQTDPVNLKHMSQVFEQALQELKTQHCRRIIRHIK